MSGRYLILGLILSLAVRGANAARSVRVVDNVDGAPVVGATVIDRSGVILGISDGDGLIRVENESSFPITVRCVGYGPVTSSEDTIRLEVTAFQLDEVVITPIDRPIKRVLCFAREYSSGISGTDTMLYYCEYMAEAFLADGKVKGYKKHDARPCAKAYKRYARIVKEGRDSTFSPRYNDDVAELSWGEFLTFLPTEKMELPEALRNGAESDTVYGKYGPQFIYRRKNGLFTKTADVLSNHKNRKWSPFFFKLLGMTVDIDAGSWTMTYADNESGHYEINDFISGTYNIHLIGRGKWIKKVFGTKLPVEMSTYLEMCPVEITNCTVAEYKEMAGDFTRLPFRYPAGLRPLSPAIQRLVEMVDSLQPER